MIKKGKDYIGHKLRTVFSIPAIRKFDIELTSVLGNKTD